MRKVAIYRSDLLPVSETFIRDQATFLANWQPILVGRRELPDGLATPGVQHAIVPPAGGRIARALRFWLERPDPALVARLQALRVDLVHAHFGTDATEVWPSVAAAGLPLLVTLHGYDINIHRAWWEAGHGGSRGRVYPRRLLAMARRPSVRFVAVSNAILRRAVAYGIPEEKVSVVYTGVDTRRFHPGGAPLLQRRRRILFVGRMVEKKAPLRMIRSFANVRELVPDAELVMIGDGPLLAESKRLAHELGVPVAFLGVRPAADVLAQMHEARVLCLPSITAANGDAEGFGMVLLEAQSAGVPVVTSAIGGAHEGLLHGKTGLACSETGTDQLAASLCHFLRDDAMVAGASASATKFAQSRFDVRNCSSALELVYDRCCTEVSHA